METSIYYVLLSMVVMELRKSCYGNPIRKTRVVTDHEDDEFARKIVPKSIFIAPLFTRCPRGYVQNHDGQCLRVLRLSADTQLNFLLTRLNTIFMSENEIVTRNKKDDHRESFVDTTSSTTEKVQVISTRLEQNTTTIRPTSVSAVKQHTRKKERKSEGPVRVQIPVNVGKRRRKLRKTTQQPV